MDCLWVHYDPFSWPYEGRRNMRGPRMHVALPPQQPPHVRSRWKEYAPRRSSSWWSLLLVPAILCVCVVYTQVGLHARRVAGVKVRGAKEVHVHHVCRRFLCVQLVLSTCTCVRVDNDDPTLVNFFVTV